MLTDLESKAKSNIAATEAESTEDATMATDEVANMFSVKQPSEVAESEEENSTADPSVTIDMPLVVNMACEN